MTAGALAVVNGSKLDDRVIQLVRNLHLEVKPQFVLGRRVWGAERRIDLLVSHPITRERLGLECKSQTSSGSAEEKLLATVVDMDAWPLRGIIVLDGEGFTESLRKYVCGMGKAVEFTELEVWLRIFFKLELI